MQVKSIKWTLLATAALASLAFALTIQQQNVAAFNDRNNQFVYIMAVQTLRIDKSKMEQVIERINLLENKILNNSRY
jgi:hypothetical protein